MKYKLIALLLLLGCTDTPKVIIDKRPFYVDGFDKKPLPPGLCTFYVTSERKDVTRTLIDSCHFYTLYDTIKNN